MRKLIDECTRHNYVYLKRETVTIHEPLIKLIEKEVYACVECGSGLEVYNFDKVTEIK